ncbi:MAG: TadE/TadG family type IV pilus assembly protein [Rhodospirillaceae bacterium]
MTSVEFAVAASMLSALLLAVVEIGLIILTTALMEGGLRDASRFGITGQGADETERLTLILEEVETATIGLVDMDNAEIEMLIYPSFGDVGRGENFSDTNGNGTRDDGETYTDENGNGSYDDDIGVAGAGTARDVVVYRMRYPWSFMTPLAGDLIGNEDGQLILGASIVVRNEPWEDRPIGEGGGG